MKKSDYLNQYGAVAAGIVQREKTQYEEASDKQREILRKVYRNYTSQFDQPKTKYTKREKVFVPLTEMAVNHIANKTQVEVEAISILPGNDQAVGAVRVLEPAVRSQLEAINFSEYMDDETFYKTLFGMGVTATGWEYEKALNFTEINKESLDTATEGEGKPVTQIVSEKVKKDRVQLKLVPLLDCYIDPTADNLQSATSFIVRTVHTLEEVKRNPLYKNVSDLAPMGAVNDGYNNTSLNKYISGGTTINSEVPLVELYHRYGPIALSWITGKESDKDKFVEGIITVAGGDEFKCIGIRLSPYKHGNRPFEEDWYEKVPHRWYGRGVGEKAIHLQRWANETVNRHIDNAEVLQNKMFLVRRGANVDPKDLVSRAGGSIKVDDINNDIKELIHSDISGSSYKDQEIIEKMAQSLLGMFDVQDSNPETATEAAIQSRNAGSTFGAVKRRTNNFLKRLVEGHVIPLMIQFMDGESQIRIEGHPQELRDIDDLLGLAPDLARQMGNYRFIRISDMDLFNVPYEVVVDIDESGITNKAVRIQQLKDTIAMALSTPPNPDGTPRLKVDVDELFEELLNLQGLGGPRFQMDARQPQPQMSAQMPAQMPQMGGIPNETDIEAQMQPQIPNGLPTQPIV